MAAVGSNELPEKYGEPSPAHGELLLSLAALFAAFFACVFAAGGAGFAFVRAALFAGIASEGGTGAESCEGKEGQNGFHRSVNFEVWINDL